MKKFIFSLSALCLSCSLFALTPRDQMFFSAMQDEMDRTMQNLSMQNMAKPYFTTYKVVDISGYNFAASFGSLSLSAQNSDILLNITMRVGSEKEDNSFFRNFYFNTASMPGSADSYDAMRRLLWGFGDACYKEALAQFAKKQAFKKSKFFTEEYDDFSNAKAATDIEEITPKNIDKAFWENIARQTSLEGKDLGLDDFNTKINLILRPTYFLTSEGAKYLKDEVAITITFTALGKTESGVEVKDSAFLSYADLKDVPSVEQLKQTAKTLAQSIAASAKAEKATPFIGPVLLEKRAARAMFLAAFKDNIVRSRPVFSSENPKPQLGEFAQKTGLKIMPVDFDVIDDPLLKTFQNIRLAGYYKVDDEGVKAEKLQLVKDGKLLALPATRSPIKDQKHSNGHARMGITEDSLFAQSFVGNLMFLPHKTIEEKDLKQKLIEACKQEGLDYCYRITTNPTADSFAAYKVDSKTGEETLVNGIEGIVFSSRTLRDIEYAGDDLEVYNNSAINAPAFSMVSPSVILRELELKPSQKTGASKPMVARP